MNEEAEAREFLIALNAAIKARSLYPERHPLREEKLEQLVSTVGALLAGSAQTPEFFLHEGSLFFRDRLLRSASLALQALADTWSDRGVRSISIAPGTSRKEMDELMAYLADEGPQPSEKLSLNTAVLMAPEERPLAGTADALRGAYADALDLMRDMKTSIATGRVPSIGPAREAVDGLVEAVLTNPESSVLLTAMRSHDEPTFFHMVNVCILSIATGAVIGLDRDLLSVLGLGGLLHDMGKIAISNETLNRSGPLSEAEWVEIRKHPVGGASVILRSWDRMTSMAAMIAYEHHQRVDGTGYPEVRTHEQLGVLSRIVSVADTFDAITSRRPYRRADQRERALEVLTSGADLHYDPRVVRVFVRMLGYFPPGSVVQLDDGSIAVVVRNNPPVLDRPAVKVVRDPSGNQVEPELVDLSSPDTDRSIAKGLPAEEARIDPADLL